jgi:uncharacterized membrane protein YcaP (DUF421 family)
MGGVWSDILVLGVPFAEKLVRPLLVYVFLVVALRVGGKRELAQLTTLDFIVLLAVANAVQNGIIGNDNSVTGAVLGATVLFLLNGLLAWVLFRHLRLRRLVAGRPTVLVTDGAVVPRALRHERLSEDDLLCAVQEEGAATFAEVQLATLQPNGRLIVQVRPPALVEHQLAADFAALRRQLAELTDLVRGARTGGSPTPAGGSDQ